MLEPDRDQIEIFVDAVLRYAKEGFASMRAFFEEDASKPFRITPAALTGGLRFIIEAAEDDARRAAQHPKPVVFCPPLATFADKDHARERDIVEGLALSVECDEHPQQARASLEGILGLATCVVKSGGRWTNGDDVAEDKLHLHWRLAQPARNGDLAKLKQARDLAARIAGGDPSNKPVCHPIRWPGSWHRKAEPRLCEIETLNADIEIDLDNALTALEAVEPEQTETTSGNGNDYTGQTGEDWPTLVGDIISGKSYHAPLVQIAARLVGSGVLAGTVVKMLRGLMAASTAPRDARWHARYDAIPRIVASAAGKWQGGTAAEGSLPSARASSFSMTAVEWLWPNRFALGKVGLIAGLPDEGKGQILCDMAARITRGAEWPCDEGRAPQGNVILLTAEDAPNDTVVPRLAAAGADLDHVHIIGMVRNNKDNKERMFSLVTDLELLRRKIVEVGDVRMVQIDPISAYLGVGKIDSFRTTDVRAVLGPVVELAAALDVAIVAVLHFNKKLDVTNALLRISDSLAFGATARHVYAAVDDAENKRKLFVRAKNNLAGAAANKALAYRFGAREVGTDPRTSKPIWAPHVIWDAQHVDVTAAEAMQASTKSPAARDDAKKLLLDILANGPVLKTEIEEAAEANGISERTLFRAKAELGIVAKKGGFGGKGGWTWELPEQPAAQRWES